MSKNKAFQYTSPHQFEPLLPQKELGLFRERADAVAQQSIQLSSGAHPVNIASLRELVRSMNSYYSNRIEGQSTHPTNIERALHQDFSQKPDIAQLQRIALAHIDTERELENVLIHPEQSPLNSATLLKAHAALYGRLSPLDRITKDHRIVEP
ncbi:hypothetical protein [Polynucleobacter brandtiae]|uniref:hypothetical protein n=1 Tax=Polynucleobacter brandtiae TaxID=1938816 RepID=UPI001E62D733|nr:hypothetical protein [Polynucleobacter brandtiae]